MDLLTILTNSNSFMKESMKIENKTKLLNTFTNSINSELTNQHKHSLIDINMNMKNHSDQSKTYTSQYNNLNLSNYQLNSSLSGPSMFLSCRTLLPTLTTLCNTPVVASETLESLSSVKISSNSITDSKYYFFFF
ncbi:unnamed protein product [Heterobilharzia americana]|nr:unnamed protein product [Heterobilharzia americana]CAH8558462.1 unnamed protein product [Heterobilharzia americana]